MSREDVQINLALGKVGAEKSAPFFIIQLVLQDLAQKLFGALFLRILEDLRR